MLEIGVEVLGLGLQSERQTTYLVGTCIHNLAPTPISLPFLKSRLP